MSTAPISNTVFLLFSGGWSASSVFYIALHTRLLNPSARSQPHHCMLHGQQAHGIDVHFVNDHAMWWYSRLCFVHRVCAVVCRIHWHSRVSVCCTVPFKLWFMQLPFLEGNDRCLHARARCRLPIWLLFRMSVAITVFAFWTVSIWSRAVILAHC